MTILPEYSTPEINSDEFISSLKINEDEQIEPFSSSELDEILRSFPTNVIAPDETLSSNFIIDFDFFNNSNDSPSLINDDLFVQMLLDNDFSSPPPSTPPLLSLPSASPDPTFDDLFSSSSPLPKITSVDEFDAFLRDFTRNLTSHQQEVSSPIS